MAHWAELDDNNVILRILVGDNNDPNGDEGYQWLIDNLGGRWVQTSYNHNFRYRYAVVGGTYDESLDAFLYPKPFNSWVLDDKLEWIPPVPKPQDEKIYTWDEDSQTWSEVIK